jgi:hypothetical protein
MFQIIRRDIVVVDFDFCESGVMLLNELIDVRILPLFDLVNLILPPQLEFRSQ